MMRTVVAGLLLAVAAGCAPAPRPTVIPPVRQEPSPATLRVRTLVDGHAQILVMPIEEYVLASALSELAPPPGVTQDMLVPFQVQAIAARTYALANQRRHSAEGFDLCDDTHCQLVDLDRPARSRWAQIARAAVDRTRGAVILDGETPAIALFHADCGGYRASAEDVWGGTPRPYLRGGPDLLPAGAAHTTWRYVIDREKLRLALNGQPRTNVGARLDTIDVQSRDASGRARLLLLNGERAPLVRGEDFRASVSAAVGPRAIRSARFEVHREGSQFIFEGQGFGHGVGLCQRGALARAAAGESLEAILAFYFPGTTIRRVAPTTDENHEGH